MRNVIPFLAITAIAALFTAGCAGPEQKFGRGMSNTFEIVRMGETYRSVEQSAIFDSPSTGYTYGLVHGLNRSLERTGLGIYEMVTAPLPPYHPVLTRYFTPGPVFPDSYKPGLMADPLFSADIYAGYSGGNIAPFIPGSRFSVFDN